MELGHSNNFLEQNLVKYYAAAHIFSVAFLQITHFWALRITKSHQMMILICWIIPILSISDVLGVSFDDLTIFLKTLVL